MLSTDLNSKKFAIGLHDAANSPDVRLTSHVVEHHDEHEIHHSDEIHVYKIQDMLLCFGGYK